MERTEPGVAPSNAVHAAMLRVEIERRGALWVRAEGGSMWPTILHGDEVLLERADAYHPGDVVLAQCDHRLLLHRVAARRGGRLVTIGDASSEPDGEVEIDRVIALAVATRRGARLAALGPTVRFGTAALARWCLTRARLLAKRTWRRVRPRQASRLTIPIT